MVSYYIQILGIIDKLNEWNEQLNGFASEHLDSVWVRKKKKKGIILVYVWGFNTLNK